MRFLLFFFCCFVLSIVSVHAQVCTNEVYTNDINTGSPTTQFLLVLPGGGTIFGGRSFASSGHINVVKTSPGGDILFNKRVSGFSLSNLSAACLTPDKKVLIAAGPTLLLIDTNGVVQKAALTSMPWGSHYVHEIKTDAQGYVYALYEASGGGNEQIVLAKFSPDLSTVLWTKTFGDLYTAIYRSILIDDDKIFVMGSFPFTYGGDLDGSVLCFSAINGALIKQVTLALDGFKCTMKTMHKTKNGYLVEGFYLPMGTGLFSENHVVVRLDDTLRPVQAIRITGLLNTSSLYIAPDDQGGFYAGSNSGWFRFFHCNNRDSVTWSRLIVTSGAGMGKFAASPTNLYAVDQSGWSIVKTDLFGRAGSCNSSNYPTGTAPLTPTTINKSVTAANGFLSISNTTNNVTNEPFNITRQCKAISTCNALVVVGPTNVCSNGLPTLFTGRRNNGCRLPVQWKINGSQADLTTLNDSTVSVQFLSSGHYQLIATLPSSCEVIADTLELNVTASSQQALSLGPDLELCGNNTFLLNAHKGYSSYAWQDNSTDSTFTVTQPGTYYVTVTDACGGVFRDTVIVTAAPPIPFDAGPERSKCNQDTLQLTAPAGFLNYSWSPAYNLSSATQPSVVVNPTVDTVYYVRAEKTPGCFAYDTIRIKVFTSPPIDLGADVSFCSGDSVVLDAGSGFSAYLWDNSSDGQYKSVHAAGTYTVIGQTAEGCRSFDTVRVINVWALPKVNLDKDSALCSGTMKTLSAGVFPAYLWQDGTSAPTLTVSDVGRYWVQVTDNNGCVGSDTTEVTTILPLPHNFLPGDTSICTYGVTTLKPSPIFRSYQWSDNSRSSALVVDKPGVYWLEVTDKEGCIGRDSIMVSPRQCMTGVYVPTAFTPNRDGRNDVFRAMVFGKTKKFVLTVYNRWGQVVFYTTDPNRGWDGKISGTDQRTDVFVWTCSYQLEGDTERMQKGTVTLVK